MCALLSFAVFADAQGDDLKAILRKAIEAHGGEKLLTKYQAGSSKFKGKIKILNMDADMSGETMFQKPDKLKNAITLNIMNKEIDIVQVFDGKTFWVSIMGKTMEIKDDKIVKEMRETLRAEGGGSFVDMLKGGYDLSSVGDVKVKGKDAVGILVKKEGQRDITYFFDKKTFLVVKSEQRTLDGMSGQEYTQEKFITEYQVKDGLKVGKRVEIRKDGEEFMDIQILDVRIVEKFDASNFAKP
jgi:hypothetical protein